MTVQNQSELVQEIYNLDEFKSIIQDNELVVLDFYSTQCPPCVVSVYFLNFFHKFEVLTKTSGRCSIIHTLSRKIL